MKYSKIGLEYHDGFTGQADFQRQWDYHLKLAGTAMYTDLQ